jgi:hypothetical protein
MALTLLIFTVNGRKDASVLFLLDFLVLLKISVLLKLPEYLEQIARRETFHSRLKKSMRRLRNRESLQPFSFS